MNREKKELIITKYLFQKANKKRIPLGGTFELSPICNMDCKMCYIKKTNNEVEMCGGLKTKDEWLELAKECKKEGMLYLLLTGGEPLLYKEFKELYVELKNMGFVISINTNGTMIDKDMAKWFAKYPPSRINITLYGASNDTYKRLCNNPKGFDQAMNAIKLLKDNGVLVKLNASMTPYNMCDFEEIHNIAKNNELVLQTSSYMFPPIRRNESLIGNGDRFTPKQCAQHTVKNDTLKLSEADFIRKTKLLQESIIDAKNYNEHLNNYDEGMLCRAGKSTFWITWDGKMTPCGMMNEPYTYPFKNGFRESWNEMVNEVEKIKIYSGCKSCKYTKVCSKCAAMIIAETGSFNKRPEYICSMTRNIVEESIKVCQDIEDKEKVLV